MKPMSDRKIFLDSNVCLYLLSEDSQKKQQAEYLLALPFTVISTQVIGENINVALKKLKLPPERVKNHIDFLLTSCELVTISPELQKRSIDLFIKYRYSFYDCLIIGAAQTSRCSVLYSEDLQNGQAIGSDLIITNPFT